ncbi:hypothetical protein HDU89_003767 [Geranomyces variabilis]|nr:hypothetical protein HDU89_003767 [Geranomyces variabilis]
MSNSVAAGRRPNIMPFHPTNFPDGLTATSSVDDVRTALTKVFTNELEQDAGTIASIDHITREDIVALAQHRARHFYHAEEFSQKTLNILDPEHYMHGHKISRAVADVLKQPFGLSESLTKPKRFRRVDLNWRDELAAIVNENEDPNATNPVIKFQLYWRVVVLKPGTSLTQLFQAYKTLRSGDDAWCDAVADFAEDHLPPQGEPVALHYVGITIRHPGLRAQEEAVDAELTRQGQMAAAAQALDVLDGVRMYVIYEHELPVTPFVIRPTAEGHLAWHLRRHRNVVDTERLLRTLLHIPALNVAMGGLDQAYRTRSATNALVTAAAARAAQDLQNIPARVSQGNASAVVLKDQLREVYDNDMPQVFEEAMAISSSSSSVEDPKALAIGQLVITMTLGKDITKEAVRFQIPFYDVELGGVGPRTHVRHCEAWIDQVFMTLYQGSGGVEAYQALRDVLLGPFRNVYETFWQEDPEALIWWLQKVLLVVKPWHIRSMGVDAFAVLAYGHLENAVAVPDPDATGMFRPQPAVNKYGRPLAASLKMPGLYLSAIGKPVIVRFGPEPGNSAIAMPSMDPGVYAHDPWISAFRMEINELIIAQDGIISAVINACIPAGGDITGEARDALLIDNVLPTVTGIFSELGLTEKLDQYKAQLAILLSYFGKEQARQRTGKLAEPRQSFVERKSRELLMKGEPDSPERIAQVQELEQERTDLEARGLGGEFLRVLLPVPKGQEAADQVDAWSDFLLALPRDRNAFESAKPAGHIRAGGYTSRCQKRRQEALQRSNARKKTIKGATAADRHLYQTVLDVGVVEWAAKIDRATFYNLAICPTCDERFPTAGRRGVNPGIAVHGATHSPAVTVKDFIQSTKVVFLHHVISHEQHGNNADLADLVEFVSIEELLDISEVRADYPDALSEHWSRAVRLGKVVPIPRDIMAEIRDVPPMPSGADDDDDALPEGCEPGDALEEDVATEAEDAIHRNAEDYGRQLALDFIYGRDAALEEGRSSSSSSGAAHALSHLTLDQRMFVGTRTAAWWSKKIMNLKLDRKDTEWRWAVCTNPEHNCPNTKTQNTGAKLDWIYGSPVVSDFLSLPSAYKVQIFDALLFEKKSVQATLAQVELTAKTIAWWRRRDPPILGGETLPRQIAAREPVPLNLLVWGKEKLRTRTPKEVMEDVRKQLREFRSLKLHRQGSSMETASFAFLKTLGYQDPTFRTTIVRKIRAEEAEEVGAKSKKAANLYPSHSAQSLHADEDEDEAEVEGGGAPQKRAAPEGEGAGPSAKRPRSG